MVKDINDFFRRNDEGRLLDDSFKNLNNPPESARETVRLVEKLRESAEKCGEVISFN